MKKIFRWAHKGGSDVMVNITPKPSLRNGRKGGFAVLDQGLFALSNFLINILLARWLSPNDCRTRGNILVDAYKVNS